MPIDEFAWAVNHDVALLSLTNVETDLLTHVDYTQLPPFALPYEPFPVRETTLDSAERGEGGGSIAWTWNVIPLTGYIYIVQTYFYVSGSRVNFREMTWNSLNDLYGYSRYNVTAIRPEPGSVDIESGLAFDVVIRANVNDEL